MNILFCLSIPLLLLFSLPLSTAWQLPKLTVPFTHTYESVVRKDYPIDTKGSLAVENVFGDITITPWKQSKIEIKATKQGAQEDVQDTEIHITPKLDHITIKTVLPAESPKVKVHYHIMVPSSVKLSCITTKKGKIKIKHMEEYISASTQSQGSIEVTGACSTVIIQSADAIKLGQLELPADGHILLESMHGNIEVSLPETIHAQLRARAPKGKVTSKQKLVFDGLTIALNDENIKRYLQQDITALLGEKDTATAAITVTASKGNIKITEN